MSLVANGIEARGIPTLLVGTVRDIMEQAGAPRSVFVDFPVGRTFGHPHDEAQHRHVLASAFQELERFTGPGQIRDLEVQWASGDRSWEQLVQDELLRRHA